MSHINKMFNHKIYIYVSAQNIKVCQDQIVQIMKSIKLKKDFIIFSDITSKSNSLLDRPNFKLLLEQLKSNNERILYVLNKNVLGSKNDLPDVLKELNNLNITLVSISNDLVVNHKIIFGYPSLKILKELKFNSTAYQIILIYMGLINIPALLSFIYLLYNQDIIIPSFDIHDLRFVVEMAKEQIIEVFNPPIEEVNSVNDLNKEIKEVNNEIKVNEVEKKNVKNNFLINHGDKIILGGLLIIILIYNNPL